MLTRDLRILKANQYSYDTEAFALALLPQKAPYSTIIKRYQIDYSFEQKYKLGIMTPSEYMAWQAQLFEEAQKKQSEAAAGRKDHTFWEDDEGVRENVSDADYNSFLSTNGLDVSNNAMVDIDAIIRESQERMAAQEEIAAAPEPESAAAGGHLPGDDDPNRVLTQDEIAALFAAMGTN